MDEAAWMDSDESKTNPCLESISYSQPGDESTWMKREFPSEAPTVQHPALLTDDLLLQRDTAAASILDASERAELDGNFDRMILR